MSSNENKKKYKRFLDEDPTQKELNILEASIKYERQIQEAQKKLEMKEMEQAFRADYEKKNMIKLSKKDENNLKRTVTGGSRKKCVKQTTKKYNKRLSPPYPANECKGMKKKGNNGKFWVSKPDKNKVYKWVPMTSITEKKSKTKKNRKTFLELYNFSTR